MTRRRPARASPARRDEVAIYAVSYHSMTASYGPNYIEANSPEEAKRKFGQGVFTRAELGLVAARQVSDREILEKLREERR